MVKQLQESLAQRDTELVTLRAALAKGQGDRDVAILDILKVLRDQNEKLVAQLAQRDAENAELRRRVYGPRRERITPLEREAAERAKKSAAERRDAAAAARAAARAANKELPQVEIIHPVAPAAEVCNKCCGTFRLLGEGERSDEIEYVPGRFVRRRHRRERKVCRCGECIVVAPAPARVADGVQYGPGLHAYVAVAKCADSMPLYRLAKALRREGIAINDSSLGDMFHRAGELLAPLAKRILEQVAACGYVNADETPIRVQAKNKTRRAYVWTFFGGGQVGYCYSPSRSGDTPAAVLGCYAGYLQVDQYTGYSRVCTPQRWTRVGCLAHVRRYFFNAQETAPEAARAAMEKILEIYQVEHEAAERGVLGSAVHLALRQQRSRPLMDALHAWLLDQRSDHPPKGPMGKAIGYALGAWPSLLEIFADARLSLDNNASERALRIIALGRKNFLFLGNDQAGENLAVLQTLIGSCDLAGVNPQRYLTDVLIRIQDHPSQRIDELLPRHWQHYFGPATGDPPPADTDLAPN